MFYNLGVVTSYIDKMHENKDSFRLVLNMFKELILADNMAHFRSRRNKNSSIIKLMVLLKKA